MAVFALFVSFRCIPALFRDISGQAIPLTSALLLINHAILPENVNRYRHDG
ncbi:hypothetical protein J2S25_000789 [Mesobacillus stamsii]|uniref:Uncharacterized protein n=1 Tax=Mesobacillus stamsii TaxID=225347 RepID=A0ABU0FRR8_9BACI|nr:hypothetical protein [Mesobacillus stamsii]